MCALLTVGGHEEASVDLSGVTEVWLDLLPSSIEPPLVDADGSDVQHVETELPEKQNQQQSQVWDLFCSVCVYI